MAGTDVFTWLGRDLHRLASEGMPPMPTSPMASSRAEWWRDFARRMLRDPFIKERLRAVLRIPVTEAQLPDLARVFDDAYHEAYADDRDADSWPAHHMRCVEAGLRAAFRVQIDRPPIAP